MAEIKIKGQVKEVYFSDEKKKSYVTIYDTESASDFNVQFDGSVDLRKKDMIDCIMQVESRVYKGANSLLCRHLINNPMKKGE